MNSLLKTREKSLLKGTTCYLSGPIDQAEDGGVSWRQEIIPYLESLGINYFDPTNKPHGLTEFTESEKELEKANALRKEKKWSELSSYIKKIIRVDLRLVDISDFVIGYVDKNVFMCGTTHELVVANQQKKPVLLIVQGGIDECPGWLIGLFRPEEIFASVEECIEYLRSINEETADDRWVIYRSDENG